MFKKDSIAYKYLKVFILIIVLPIFIISIIVNNIYINILLKNSSDRILQSMEQISIGINNEVRNLILSEATVCEAHDYEILDLVTQWNRAPESDKQFEISKQIDTKLNYLFNYRNDIETIMFFIKDRGLYYYKNNPTVDEEAIRNSDWYQKTLKNNGKAVIFGTGKSFVSNSQGEFLISVAVSPTLPKYRNDVELIYFAFSTNVFDSIISDSGIDHLGTFTILDERGRIMVSRDKNQLGKGAEHFSDLKIALKPDSSSFTEYINNRKVLITHHTIQKTNWKIVNVIDYKELTRDIDTVLSYAIVIYTVIIALFIIFSILFFRDILNPVNSLVKGMKRVEEGDFDVNVAIKGDGEIQNLSRSFNKMVYEIKTLLAERNLKERERSKAEIEALQSQINPHFISNTLNSIRLMAMIAKVDSIKNITEAFMKLLSESFGRGGTITTVGMEIENLKNYTYIMKVRYGDKFDVDFEVDDEIREYYILKLLLQPILENSITHGISEIEEKGRVTIKGCKAREDLLFEITDNGIGMTEESINRLLSEDYKNPKGFSSIGIKNVNQRIKLNHGEKYGLSIESKTGEYTRVKILLPALKDKGEINIA